MLTKLLGKLSAGLLTEVLYNRLGLMGASRLHSVYAQVQVPDAYAMQAGPMPLQAQTDRILAATDGTRATQPFANLHSSQRPELYLPGIHLHHTLDTVALAAEGLNEPSTPVQVIDASAIPDLGAEHHSFKMLVSAYRRVQRSPSAETQP